MSDTHMLLHAVILYLSITATFFPVVKFFHVTYRSSKIFNVMFVNNEESVSLENVEWHKYTLTCFRATTASTFRLEKEEFVSVTSVFFFFF